MPVATIPLIGQSTSGRGLEFSTSKDHRFTNILFEVIQDPQKGTKNIYAIKRSGMTPSAGASAITTDVIYDTNVFALCYGRGADQTSTTDSNIIVGGSVAAGTTTDSSWNFSVVKQGSVYYLMIPTRGTTSWYVPSDSISDNSFTADTNGTAVLTNIAGTTDPLYPGQLLTAAADIPAGTRIQTVDSATQVTMTAAATGSTVGLAITKTPLAKILTTNFPTNVVSKFEEMDGYVFFLTSDAKLYNFNLNDIDTLGANNYISVDQSGSSGAAIIKYRDFIIAFTKLDCEFFQNSGNPSGSILNRRKDLTSKIGTINQDSVSAVHDNVFFISSGYEGSMGVYFIDGLIPRRVSTFSIDARLNQYSLPAVNYVCRAFSLLGNTYCAVSLYDSSSHVITFIYNLENNTWIEWTGQYHHLVAGGNLASSNGYLLYTASRVASTTLFGYWLPLMGAWNYDFAPSGSNLFTMTLQMEPWSPNGGRPFTVNSVRLLADNQASGTTTLKASPDDYTTDRTIGTFAMTSTRKEIRRGGYFKSGSCAFKLEHSDNTPWRGQALVVDWSPVP